MTVSSDAHGESLESWIRARIPSLPDSFLDLLLKEGEGEMDDSPACLSRGLAALERALKFPGRVRSSAYLLLAADAWITYACEDAARGEDPRELLEGLLRRLGERFS